MEIATSDLKLVIQV